MLNPFHFILDCFYHACVHGSLVDYSLMSIFKNAGLSSEELSPNCIYNHSMVLMLFLSSLHGSDVVSFLSIPFFYFFMKTEIKSRVVSTCNCVTSGYSGVNCKPRVLKRQ